MDAVNSESYPSVDFATAIISTNYDGASAEEVESRITKPIEEEIRSVTNIKEVRSVSQAGRSTIFVKADIDKVNVKTSWPIFKEVSIECLIYLQT